MPPRRHANPLQKRPNSKAPKSINGDASTISRGYFPDDLSTLGSGTTFATTVMSNGTKVNKLHELIEMGRWDDVPPLLRSEGGAEMAAEIYPKSQRDFPLHLVCDFDVTRHMDGNRQGADDNEQQEARLPPPLEVILSLLETFPEAAMTKGRYGSLPLHIAIKRGHSIKVIEALIRAYPKALDVKDNKKRTPRDLLDDDCDADLFSFIERPTICWKNQIEDDEIRDEMNDDLNKLEREVEMLRREVEESLVYEKKLMARLVVMEQHVGKYEDPSTKLTVAGQVEDLEAILKAETREMKVVTDSFHEMFRKEIDEKKMEREYMSNFIDDVMKVYEGLEVSLNHYKVELDEIMNMPNISSTRRA